MLPGAVFPGSILEVCSMKIFVHPAVCDGAGTCARLAPKYFAIGTDGKSHVVTQDIAEGEDVLLKQAEAACPYGAIVLLDD
jgi:ferredoxin